MVCRLDSDTLFIPNNLRRIVACRNFSVDEPWAIGYENYLHKHAQPGHAFFEGGTGICLSRGGVARLLQAARQGGFKESPRPGDWTLKGCISAPGHWDDVMLGSCMAAIGIPLSRWGTDCHGRNLFWPHRLDAALPGPSQVRAPKAPPRATFFAPPDFAAGGVEVDVGIARYYRWRYRAWQHLGCHPRHWIGEFPVSFHPYRNATEWRMAFATVQEARTILGYTPRVWNGQLDQCEDLWC